MFIPKRKMKILHQITKFYVYYSSIVIKKYMCSNFIYHRCKVNFIDPFNVMSYLWWFLLCMWIKKLVRVGFVFETFVDENLLVSTDLPTSYILTTIIFKQ